MLYRYRKYRYRYTAAQSEVLTVSQQRWQQGPEVPTQGSSSHMATTQQGKVLHLTTPCTVPPLIPLYTHFIALYLLLIPLYLPLIHMYLLLKPLFHILIPLTVPPSHTTRLVPI